MKKAPIKWVLLFLCLFLLAFSINGIKPVFLQIQSNDKNDLSSISTSSTNTSAINLSIEKGILLNIEDQLEPEGFVTRADLIRFIVQYHSEWNNKTFESDTNGDITAYIQYATQNELLKSDWGINVDNDDQAKIEKPISTLNFAEGLHEALPDLKLELKHNAVQLNTFNTQDEIGKYILSLCNAGILEESSRDFHWYRILTRAEFADIIERLYHPQKRKVRILDESQNAFVVKELNLSTDEYDIIEIYGDFMILQRKEDKQAALFDAKKNKIIFQGMGYIKVLEEAMFAFSSETKEGMFTCNSEMNTLILNSDGKSVFNKAVDFVTNYANGSCVVRYPNDNNLYFINKEGEEIKKQFFPEDELEPDFVNLVYYLGTRALYDHGAMDTLRLYNYETGEFIDFNHMFAGYLPNGKIFVIKKIPYKSTVLNKDLSPIVQTDYEYIDTINNEYNIMVENDLENMQKVVSILNQSGEAVLTHRLGSEGIISNISTDAVLIQENRKEYAYTNINLTTLSKEFFYAMDISDIGVYENRIGPIIDSHGRRITPEGSLNGYTLSIPYDVLREFSSTFFYQFEDRLYHLGIRK